MSRKRDLQVIIDAKREALDKVERKAEDLKILLATMEEQAKVQYEEKKKLEKEIANQKSLIIKIKWLSKVNKYNNEKAILNKIKELVNDYQSNN